VVGRYVTFLDDGMGLVGENDTDEKGGWICYYLMWANYLPP
jgi:hypothetical protein